MSKTYTTKISLADRNRIGEVHTGVRALKELREQGARPSGSVVPLACPHGSMRIYVEGLYIVFEWTEVTLDEQLQEL